MTTTKVDIAVHVQLLGKLNFQGIHLFHRLRLFDSPEQLFNTKYLQKSEYQTTFEEFGPKLV